MINFAVGQPDISFIEPLWYITATTTVASGISYMDGSGLRAISKYSGKEKISSEIEENRNVLYSPSITSIPPFKEMKKVEQEKNVK